MVLGVSRTLGTESVVVRTVMESSLLELITANDAVMHFLRICHLQPLGGSAGSIVMLMVFFSSDSFFSLLTVSRLETNKTPLFQLSRRAVVVLKIRSAKHIKSWLVLTATATGCKSLARGVRGYIHVHAIDASLQSLAQNLDLESGSVKRVLPLRLFDSTIHLSSERMSFLSDRVFSAWAFLVQSLYSRQKVYTRSEA